MTKVRKEDERFLRIIKKLESMEDSPGKTKALARMKQGHEKWKKEIGPKIDKWSEAVAGQVSISKAAKTFPTPNLDQIAEARPDVTREDYEKPFIDIQNVALEKLEREKRKAYDVQSKLANPESGSKWKWLTNWFTGAENFMGLPSGVKEQRLIDDMIEKGGPGELYRYNLQRGLDPDNPITQAAYENLQYEHGAGLGFSGAGGGIATLHPRRPGALPPPSGPDSQGLAYLNNYATKRTE